MKVKDLIEKLKEYDDDLDIFVCQREPAKYSNASAVFENTSYPIITGEGESYDYVVISDDTEENSL